VNFNVTVKNGHGGSRTFAVNGSDPLTVLRDELWVDREGIPLSQQKFVFRNSDGVLITLPDGNQTFDQVGIGPLTCVYLILNLKSAGNELEDYAWMSEPPQAPSFDLFVYLDVITTNRDLLRYHDQSQPITTCFVITTNRFAKITDLKRKVEQVSGVPASEFNLVSHGVIMTPQSTPILGFYDIGPNSPNVRMCRKRSKSNSVQTTLQGAPAQCDPISVALDADLERTERDFQGTDMQQALQASIETRRFELFG